MLKYVGMWRYAYSGGIDVVVLMMVFATIDDGKATLVNVIRRRRILMTCAYSQMAVRKADIRPGMTGVVTVWRDGDGDGSICARHWWPIRWWWLMMMMARPMMMMAKRCIMTIDNGVNWNDIIIGVTDIDDDLWW